MVQTLEERLRTASHQQSPEELSKQASTAAQIDNETLKEQVTHLQQRISHLEDQLEDAQVLVEREEAAAKSRVARYKEKDTQRQQELEELRDLAATSAKSESTARARVEELEEALRENTATLEDARAEIESLRTDLTVSDTLTTDNSQLTLPEPRKLDGTLSGRAGSGTSQPDFCNRGKAPQSFIGRIETRNESYCRSAGGRKVPIRRS